MDKDKFEFRLLREIESPSLAKNRNELEKWSMKDGLRFQGFSFDRPYKAYLMETFVQDFLSSPEVVQSLEVLNPNHRFGPIGIPAEYVRMRGLKCSLSTMSIFTKLTEAERVVRESGDIKKCVDDFVTPWLDEADCFGDPIQIGNELRKMLLVPSEVSDVFSDEEKDEFLVRIFGHLVIGGSLCQYEDILSPYLTVTKLLYKDLVSIQADNGGEGDSTKIVSELIQILSTRPAEESKGTSQDLLFAKPNVNNFFYLVVDPFQRIVKTFYHHA